MVLPDSGRRPQYGLPPIAARFIDEVIDGIGVHEPPYEQPER